MFQLFHLPFRRMLQVLHLDISKVDRVLHMLQYHPPVVAARGRRERAQMPRGVGQGANVMLGWRGGRVQVRAFGRGTTIPFNKVTHQ
jgi:hypothetical protein